MADIVSKKKRSEMMSMVRSKDSEIEKLFRKYLWRSGFRYRKNSNKYYGKPDVVLPKYKTIIFIDSCFWHGCAKHGTFPLTRPRFWAKKIARNRMRDKEVNRHYKETRWNVVRTWEHDLKKKDFKFDFKKIKYGYKK